MKNRSNRGRFGAGSRQTFKRGELSVIFRILGGILVACLVAIIVASASTLRHDERIQEAVEQIMVGIKDGDYADAFVKASSLYWHDHLNYKDEDK